MSVECAFVYFCGILCFSVKRGKRARRREAALRATVETTLRHHSVSYTSHRAASPGWSPVRRTCLHVASSRYDLQVRHQHCSSRNTLPIGTNLTVNVYLVFSNTVLHFCLTGDARRQKAASVYLNLMSLRRS